MREHTNNRKSLRDLLIPVLDAGLTLNTAATMDDVLRVMDAQIGVPIVRDLYAKHALAPGSFDLDALWKDLGVRVEGNDIVVNDEARLAHIRRAITDEKAS